MAQENKDAKHGLKVVVVGDGAVGKTSMLVSAVTGQFPKEYIPTVFDNHEMDKELDGKSSRVILYDTAGQEEYESLRLLSYPDTDVFLVVFSVQSSPSFDNIEKKWLKEVRHHRPFTPCIIIGAKADLREDDGIIAEMKSLGRPMLDKEEYEKRAMELGAAKYIECSAATQENISLVIEEAIRVARKARTEEKQREEIRRTQASTESGGCCSIC